MRTEKDVIRLWKANEALLRERIHPLVIEPLSKPPGLPTEVEWDYILATSLARCFDTFRAVQILCSTNTEARFWVDGLVLSRSIFEVSVTLDWCKKAPENLQRFLDDYHLLVARQLEAMPDARKAEVKPERQTQILEREATVRQKYERGPGKMSVMSNLEQMCRRLSKGEKEPNKLWEYENYYRDASRFAHPTAWHLFSYRAKLTPITEVVPSPDSGYRALLVSGGCFLRILQLWNELLSACQTLSPTNGYKTGRHLSMDIDRLRIWGGKERRISVVAFSGAGEVNGLSPRCAEADGLPASAIPLLSTAKEGPKEGPRWEVPSNSLIIGAEGQN